MLIASHMLLNLRDVTRTSGAMVSSSGIMAVSNNGPYMRTSKSPKSGTAVSVGSRFPLYTSDISKRHIEGTSLSMSTKGMEWSYGAGATTMATATEEEGPAPVFSTVVAGLHDEQPFGATARPMVDEESGGIRHSTTSSGYHSYTSRDPYAYGASDDDDEGNLYDEYHHQRRHPHIHVSVSAHRVVEEIELGETRTRAHQSPSVGHSAHPENEVLRSRGSIWRETSEGPRTARRAPSHPTNSDRRINGSTVFNIE